ncbi:MAG TPA: hypothetical protein VMF91_10730 [Bryobacteraceae bacterium]|nr:hypothetical protein [Bryobacteraceae bacterium]
MTPTTSQAGDYRVEGLSKGTYYVSADPDPEGYAVHQTLVDSAGNVTNVRELATYFPAALSIADAQAIHIEGGQEQSGIDIRIQRAPTLTVKGRVAGIASQASHYELSADVPVGFGWTSESGKIQPSGDFTFEGLAPGKHIFRLLEHGPNGARIIAETEITLGDQDVTGLVITPFKPAEVRIRVVHEGEEDKPLTSGAVFLIPEGKENRFNGASQFVAQSSMYVFHGVRPGKYEVQFNHVPGCYLKSVESEGRMLDPESIEIAEGAKLDLLLTYSSNVASVTGDVEVPQDHTTNSVHVYG